MEDKKPLISIVVTIYNAASTLNYSIDSLVYQTLENIEIILIDKESTDNSGEIIDTYEKFFPNKVRAFHIGYSKSPGPGFNYGISVARADYVAFCDADDAMELYAAESLNTIIEKDDYDVVFFYARKNTTYSLGMVDKYDNDFTKTNLICCDVGMRTLWHSLWKKELLLKTGFLADAMGLDITYVAAALSNAKKFYSFPCVLYNHEVEHGTSKGINKLSFGSFFETLSQIQNLNINPKYKDAFYASIARRAIIFNKSAPRFSDDLILWLKENKIHFLDNPVLKKRQDVYSRIDKFINGYNFFLPKIIYVNGFGGVDKDWLCHVQEKAFNFGDAEIRILNEETCNCTSMQILIDAVKLGKYDFLGHYFALKKINETGGFFLGKHIKMNISLNSLRFLYPAIFSFINDSCMMDEFFGAFPDADVIKSILFTYENDFYDDRFCPLYQRLNNILSVQYDYLLNGKEQHHRYAHVLGLNQTTFDIGDDKNLFTYDFSDHYGEDGYIVIYKEALKYYSNSVGTPNSAGALDKKYIAQINSLKAQIEEIKISDSYKLSMRIKKFGNTKLGRIPKKIFKWFLARYRKHKYGMGI